LELGCLTLIGAVKFRGGHGSSLTINGTTVTVKVAHVRLCHSRMPFVRAYPRETQEMVFDAHNRAFAFFKGTCTRGIDDNMKTAVETVFIGKEAEWGGLECASRRPGLSRRGPKHKVSCGPSAIGERRVPFHPALY